MFKTCKFTLFRDKYKNIKYAEKCSKVESWIRSKGIRISENLSDSRGITDVLIYEVEINDDVNFKDLSREVFDLPKTIKFIDIADIF